MSNVTFIGPDAAKIAKKEDLKVFLIRKKRPNRIKKELGKKKNITMQVSFIPSLCLIILLLFIKFKHFKHFIGTIKIGNNKIKYYIPICSIQYHTNKISISPFYLIWPRYSIWWMQKISVFPNQIKRCIQYPNGISSDWKIFEILLDHWLGKELYWCTLPSFTV